MTTLAAQKFIPICSTVDAFALHYILRRLKVRVLICLGALAIFCLSPLSIHYLRQVLLVNIGLTWMPLSIAALASSRSWPWRAAIGGMPLGIAVVFKETLALFLPSAILYIAINTKAALRKFSIAVFLGTSGIVVAFYLLFAILRGEFLPGPHHTSLIGAIEWQLFQRYSGGSIFTSGTMASKFFSTRWGLDPYFLIATLASSVICLGRRSTSFIGVMNLLGAAMLVRPGGYVPAMFVIAYLGTGALAIGLGARIVIDALTAPLTSLVSLMRRWNQRNLVIDLTGAEPEISTSKRPKRVLSMDDIAKRSQRTRQVAGALLATAGLVAGSYLVYPSYALADAHLMSTAPASNNWRFVLQAERWINAHVPRRSVLITDDYLWLDLVDEGFAPTHVVWVWKYGPDPEVNQRYPNPVKDIGYIVSTADLRSTLQLPSQTYNRADIKSIKDSTVKPVFIAFEHSKPIARFGSGYFRVTIRKVVPGPAICAAQCLSYAVR